LNACRARRRKVAGTGRRQEAKTTQTSKMNEKTNPPARTKESNWLPAPNEPFSLYLRAYWPDQAILDGTWMPPNVEKVK
jgi:hypothetical protein